jgi:hypothetical protein
MSDRADFDNDTWDRNVLPWEESQKYFRRFSTLCKMESFVSKKFGKTATWVWPFHIWCTTTSIKRKSRTLMIMFFSDYPNLI